MVWYLYFTENLIRCKYLYHFVSKLGRLIGPHAHSDNELITICIG